MNSREKAYNTKIANLVEATGKLTDLEVGKIIAMLKTARTEIAARIAGTEWQVHYLPQLNESVQDAINSFTSGYKSNQETALANIFEAGVDMIDAPLRAAGFWGEMPGISRTSLEIMQAYSVDLIGGLSADMTKKINGELAMGIIGGKTPYQVMMGIGKSLKDKGIFRSIAARAETITRTEMSRVHSLARAARAKATVEANPGLPWHKQWHASGKAHPRYWHATLDGVEINVDDLFLGYIDYPHAPGLDMKDVVNCGCTHTLTMDWQRLPKEWQAMPYQNRASYN